MANVITNYLFRRTKFCCCVPVRFGVIVMSFITLLASGFVAVVLWFEVATGAFSSGATRTACILFAILNSLLFLFSCLGFSGATARKQSFLTLYTIFLYVHLFFQLGFALFFLLELNKRTGADTQRACQSRLITNDSTRQQCISLLRLAKWIYWLVSGLVLGLEAYAALIATRYTMQVKQQKIDYRLLRLQRQQRKFEEYQRRYSGMDSNGVREMMRQDGVSEMDMEMDMDDMGMPDMPDMPMRESMDGDMDDMNASLVPPSNINTNTKVGGRKMSMPFVDSPAAAKKFPFSLGGFGLGKLRLGRSGVAKGMPEKDGASQPMMEK